MTSRERVRLALNHEQPDRVPLDFGGIVTSFTYGAYRRLVEHLRIPNPQAKIGGFKVMVDTDEEILRLLEADFRNIYFSPAGDKWKTTVLPDGTMIDYWGIQYCDVGDYYEMKKFPLKNATLQDLERFPWPDFSDKDAYRGLRERAEYLHNHTPFALVGTAAVNILERAQWLRGIEEFLVDLAINQEFAVALMDKMMELLKQFLDHYLAEIGDYIDVMCLGDDLASQNQLMMSPELYRKLIKPRHAEAYSYIKKKTKAKIFHHTCGAVAPLIGDFIEIGLDILNPIQPRARGMEKEKLKSQFGTNLCFWGGIDIQHTLPRGTPQEIREEVREAIRVLGQDGGYVLGPAHNVQSDVAPENLLLMVSTAVEGSRHRGTFPRGR
jgi:uroporphyrinogen decarboxylase